MHRLRESETHYRRAFGLVKKLKTDPMRKNKRHTEADILFDTARASSRKENRLLPVATELEPELMGAGWRWILLHQMGNEETGVALVRKCCVRGTIFSHKLDQ